MKKTLLVTVLLFILVSVPAQIPIPVNPQETVILSKILATNMSSLAKTTETVSQVQAFSQTALRIKEETQQLLALQQSVENALRDASGIAGLRFSDLDFFAEKTIGVSLDPADYLPESKYTSKLIEQLRRGDADAKTAQTVYDLYHRPFNVPGWASKKKNGGLNKEQAEERFKESFERKLAIGEMETKKKIQIALIYREWATELEERAVELNSAIKTDNFLRMSDAERLAMQSQAVNMLEKSLELSMKADELMASEPSPAVQAYQQAESSRAFRSLFVSGLPSKNKKSRK